MFLKILASLFILLTSFSGWADYSYFFSARKEAVIGEWKEVPFGQVRVISCSTGVKGLSIVIGGMQVRLADGWTMKKPSLEPLSKGSFFWGEAPVRPGDGKNIVYKGCFSHHLVERGLLPKKTMHQKGASKRAFSLSIHRPNVPAFRQ